MKKITHSTEETQNFACRFAADLKGGDVLLLEGDLGTGKTTFTQGLAKYFNIDQPITSPTFVVMQLYPIPRCNTIKELCHIDAYRFQSKEDALSTGILDYIGKKDILAIIEWPSQLFDLIPQNAIKITFAHIDVNSRQIEIKEHNDINN